MSNIKVPRIEIDQIAPSGRPDHYIAAVYIDGEMINKHHTIELHEDTYAEDIIAMMEYFYELGFEEGKKSKQK